MFRIPDRILQIKDEKKRKRARVMFILRYVALMVTDTASVPELSKQLGYNRNSIFARISRGDYDEGFPVSMIFELEKMMGDMALGREVMNPYIYGQPPVAGTTTSL